MNLLAPDLRVSKLAEPIRELGELVRKSDLTIRGTIGHWESDVESFNLILLAATQAIAASTLCRSSLSMLPAVYAISRAAMEAGARAMWLLFPDDVWEREGRWLVHMESEASIRKRLTFLGDAAAVQSFSSAVREKLPPGTIVPNHVPKFDALLRSIGAPEKYSVYAYLSQTAHATHHGSGMFRKHLGTNKEYGEFVTANDWWLPLSTLWWFLANSVSKFSERVRHGQDLLPLELQEQFVAAQKALR